MHISARLMFYLKWFSILWSIGAVAVVLISHLMIVFSWSPVSKVTPLNVRNTVNVALVLAPGAIGVLIHYLLEKRLKTNGKTSAGTTAQARGPNNEKP